jgi:nucleoside-triphosphatase
VPLRILIEGRPGVGKTTVAARVADLLSEQDLTLRGFVTRELREGRLRVGFEVETFDGKRATLAHVRFPGPPRVGKYGVDLAAFERVALGALRKPPRGSVVVVDELGKMELASEPFCEEVSMLLERRLDIVATVHVFRHPFTDALKRRPDVERVQMTQSGRARLPEQVAERILTARERRASR